MTASTLSQASPRTLFDSYFRSADVLLKVYRLLEAQDATDSRELEFRLREVIPASQDEMLVLLLNDMFLGVVRERAQLPNGFFRHQNMALLLRQSVVAACTALDVYYPALLRRHLPTMIQIKQRNFVPHDKEVRAFFREVALSIDDHLRIIEDPNTQHEELGRFMLSKIERKAMANVTGITVVMKMLDFEDPWKSLSEHLGRGQNELRTTIESLVNRRNDIVHHGDRERGLDSETPRPIDYSWTQIHVSVAESVVHACDELVNRRMREYESLVGHQGANDE